MSEDVIDKPSRYDLITVTDGNFGVEVLHAQQPVALEVWAPWCQPCKTYSRVVEKVVSGFVDKTILAKANVDDCPSMRKRLGLSMLPTLIVFDNGTEMARIEGVCTGKELTAFLKHVLDN